MARELKKKYAGKVSDEAHTPSWEDFYASMPPNQRTANFYSHLQPPIVRLDWTVECGNCPATDAWSS